MRNSINRFEKAARKLASDMGYAVHIEWAPANQEYVVDGYPAGNIREARRIAIRERAKYHTSIRHG